MKRNKGTGWIRWFFFWIGMALFVTGTGVAIVIFLAKEVPPGLWVLPLVFTAIGAVLLLVGIVLLVRGSRRRKLEAQLRLEGQLLEAQYLDCDPNYHVIVNGMPLRTLRCVYTDANGFQHLFTRKSILEDPLPFLENGVVKVYCKRDDWNVYFVDVEGSYATSIIEH